jgi:hypothetical protein
MNNPGIANTPPAMLIGKEAVEKLHEAGYRIVPKQATHSMKDAAMKAMWPRNRRGLSWVSDMEKAGIRYEAMLAAWKIDSKGMVQGAQLDQLGAQFAGKKPSWRWRLGRWFDMRLYWKIERGT